MQQSDLTQLKETNSNKPIIAGIISMLVGGSLMIVASVLINKVVKIEKVETISDIVSFKVESVESTKPSNKSTMAKSRVTKEKKSSSKKLDISSSLGASLPGLDFGVGSAASDALGVDLSRSIMEDSKNAVMSSENVDVEPRPLRTVSPEYPQEARDKKLTGYVSMNLLINENGKVDKALVTDSQPKGVFDNAALDSVRAWLFEPARYQGQKVKVWAQQKVRFEAN